MDDETMLLDAARRHDERIRRQLERARQLEQLVKDGLELLEGIGDWTAWEERAKALIAQEV